MRRALILLVTRVGWGQEVGGNREGEGGALMSAATRRAVIPIEAYRCSLENLAFLRIVIREGVAVGVCRSWELSWNSRAGRRLATTAQPSDLGHLLAQVDEEAALEQAVKFCQVHLGAAAQRQVSMTRLCQPDGGGHTPGSRL